MKIINVVLFLLIVINSQNVHSQNIKKIFKYLEKNNIEKAVIEYKKNDVISEYTETDKLLYKTTNIILKNNNTFENYDPYSALKSLNDFNNSQRLNIDKYIIKYEFSLEQIEKDIYTNIFDIAKGENTEKSYQKAISHCSSCYYKEEALKLQEEAAYQEAKIKNNISAYEYYVNKYPNSNNYSKAYTSLVNLEYSKAKSSNNITDLDYFLKTYKGSKYELLVNLKRDSLAFNNTSKTYKDYNQFIKTSLTKEYKEKAELELPDILYNEALSTNNKELFETFIRKYPSDLRVDTINGKLEFICYKEVLGDFSEEKFTKFKQKYPNSNYSEKILTNKFLFPIFKKDSINQIDKIGFININGEVIVPPIYNNKRHSKFKDGLVKLMLNGKYGYIDKDGETVIEFKYDRAGNFHYGLAEVYINKKRKIINKKGLDATEEEIKIQRQLLRKYDKNKAADTTAVLSENINKDKGFINKEVQKTLETQFDGVEDVIDDISIIYHNHKYGMVNKNGQIIFKPQFDNIDRDYSDKNIFLVRFEYGYGKNARLETGVVNKKGEYLIKPDKFSIIDGFYLKGGIAIASLQGDGFDEVLINKRGKLMSPVFCRISWFKNESRIVKVRGGKNCRRIVKWRLMTIEGEYISDEFDAIDNTGNNIKDLLIIEKNEKLGLINKKGEIIVAPKFDYIREWRNPNLLETEMNGKYGLINDKGKIILTAKYKWLGLDNFNKDGIVIVNLDGKRGLMNKDGKVIVTPKFDKMKDFKEGFARVELNKKYGFINKEGKIVIKPQFDKSTDFYNGLALCKLGEQYIYVNKKGVRVFSFTAYNLHI